MTIFKVSGDQFVNWRWQINKQLRTANDFNSILSLKEEEKEAFTQCEELFNAGVTPYYAALIRKHDSSKTSQQLRLQAIPEKRELTDIHGNQDPLDEVPHSPVPEVVHLYPDRVAFCVAMLCPVYCRYCFRKRRDDETGLHFNRKIIDKGLKYIQSNSAIKDVLITGGILFILR